MLEQVESPGTDDWWLYRLATEMGQQIPRIRKLRAYLDGEPPVDDGGIGKGVDEESPFVQRVRSAYRDTLRFGRLNVAETIVNAVADRLHVTAFRTSTPGDTEGDANSQAVWKTNWMARQSRRLFSDQIAYGRSYLLVGSDGSLTVPDIEQTYTLTGQGELTPSHGVLYSYDPVGQVELLDMFWRDSNDNVWYRSATRENKTGSSWPRDDQQNIMWYPGTDWTWDQDKTVLPWCRLDTGAIIPLIAFETRTGQGAFETHLSELDRLNTTIFQRVVITTMQSFKQRWISGEIEKYYPEDWPDPALRGQPIDYNKKFAAGPASMWLLPGDVKVNETTNVDITPILTAIQADLKHIGTVTGTPLYLLVPDAVNQSASGAEAMREAVHFRVAELQEINGDNIAAAIMLALSATDKPREDTLQVSWGPQELVSVTDLGAAAAQWATVMPASTILRELFHWTPDQIAQAKVDAQESQLSLVAQQAAATGQTASVYSGSVRENLYGQSANQDGTPSGVANLAQPQPDGSLLASLGADSGAQ
jgi:hypothetical protein